MVRSRLLVGGRGLGNLTWGKGERQSAGKANNRDGKGDGQDGGKGLGVVQDELGLNAESDDVAEIDIHTSLEPALAHTTTALAPCWTSPCSSGLSMAVRSGQDSAVLVDRDNAAVGEDGKLLAQRYVGDADLVEKVRATSAVQGAGKRVEDGVVLQSVGSELSNGLSNQDVEPVQTLGLVAVNIVIRLCQNLLSGEDVLAAGDTGCRRGTIEAQQRRLAAQVADAAAAEGRRVREGALATDGSAISSTGISRRGFSKDEELDKEKENQGQGQLAEEEARREAVRA